MSIVDEKIFASEDELCSVFYDLPPGKYFVGDLCYVIDNQEDWIKFFCDPSLKDGDGIYSYKGKEFMIWGTGGDGFFPFIGALHEEDHELSGCVMVDSGSIGVIPVDLIEVHEMQSICDAEHGFILDCKNGLSVSLIVEDDEEHTDKGDVYQVEFYDMPDDGDSAALYDDGSYVFLKVKDTHDDLLAEELATAMADKLKSAA